MKHFFNNKIFQFSSTLIIGLSLGWLLFKQNSNSQIGHTQQLLQESVYSCSMHPQIRQKEPGKCPLCGMDLTPLTSKSSKTDNNLYLHTMSENAIALANIQTEKVKKEIPENEIYLTGKIAINEQKLAVIVANYAGRLETLSVNFIGQSVSKGQKLASIYSPELITAQKELLEAIKFKEINPALYKASKEKLRLWKVTEMQINAIENNGTLLTEFDVFSDQSGVVTKMNISKGDFVNKGNVLFEVVDLSNVWVILDAYEKDFDFLQVGQKINFTVATFPEKEFTTNISFIAPFIRPQTRTASIRAEFQNPDQILKPEMFVKSKIKVDMTASGKKIMIPKSALLWTGKRSIVYVKTRSSEFPVFEMREIALGNAIDEKYYLVNGGLSEGEEIVTNGVFAVDGAAQLSGKYSMMNQPINKTISVPDEFKTMLTEFLNHHFELQNNLVASDSQKTKLKAKELKTALGRIDDNLLQGNALSVWVEYSTKLKHDLKQLLENDDIEKQREYFSILSNQIIEIIERFELKIEIVYVAYCPMALNDKGAYWLTNIDEISNPYFGDSMLKCGEIVKTVRNNISNQTK